MSNPPPDHGSTPEFGWSLPPEETPLPPPPPPPAFGAPPAPPSPTTGFGGPPGQYIPGPLTASQIQANTPMPIPSLTPVPEPTPLWKRWWFIAAAVIVLVGVGALVVTSGGDDAEQASETTEETEETDETEPTDETSETDDTVPVTIPQVPPVSIPEISVPDISIPDISIPEISIPDISIPEIPGVTVPGGDQPSGDLAVIGETVSLDDGGTIRLNSVTAGAAPTQDFFDVDEGNALTRLDFEVCAGSTGFSAFNPLFWEGILDDGEEASSFLFSFPILVLTLAPGACGRSQIDFEAPADRTVVSVGARNYVFEVTARWDTTAPPVAFDGALTSAAPITRTPAGTAATLPDGSTVTVRSVTAPGNPLDETFPAEPGYVYIQADVEVCAGTTAVTIPPTSFFGTLDIGWMGSASSYGSTLPTDATPPGECVSGLVDLQMPEGGTLTDVFVTDELTNEVARWQVG